MAMFNSYVSLPEGIGIKVMYISWDNTIPWILMDILLTQVFIIFIFYNSNYTCMDRIVYIYMINVRPMAIVYIGYLNLNNYRK